jgi:large subunit ribosomal protein L22
MAKQAKARRLSGIEAMAKITTLRTSPRKLNLVAQSIRGLKVQRALNELEFSHKRIAQRRPQGALLGDLQRREQPQPRHRQRWSSPRPIVGKNLVMKRFAAPRPRPCDPRRKAVLRDHHRGPRTG